MSAPLPIVNIDINGYGNHRYPLGHVIHAVDVLHDESVKHWSDFNITDGWCNLANAVAIDYTNWHTFAVS